MTRVGIIGASGYAAADLMRLLLGHPDAARLHQELVRIHVTQADGYYLEGAYARALDEIELVRRLEDDNPRTAGLFKKIDEKVGFPDIEIKSVLTVRGAPSIMAAIDTRTLQLEPGDVHRNVRLVSVNHRTGEIVFEQIYTGERQQYVRTRGGKSHSIITPSGR